MCTPRTIGLRAYLPLLSDPDDEIRKLAQVDFYLEHCDWALRQAERIARTRGGRQNEDEPISAVHDAFMGIFKRAELGCLADLTEAFLITAIRFALTRHLRKDWAWMKQVRFQLDDDPEPIQPADRLAEFGEYLLDIGVLESREDVLKLPELLDQLFDEAKLPQVERQVLRLRFLVGFSRREIAEQLDVTPSRVRTVEVNAIRKLWDYLRDGGRPF